MSERTAIIDIGSNSARLVIFEKTSHYGFHLICEQKSKVRIGEGAYLKDGYLQPIGIKRAFLALQSFVHTIQRYQASKTICVATSALRDAPNREIFVKWIERELGLYIKTIDGKKEAEYGAIAANNLLPINEGITIDIGGGSSDMALIKNGNIIDTYSLNLGTVRLKELFFDKDTSLNKINTKAKAYIKDELKKLPKHFRHSLAIGIGGTARTLSKSIMKNIAYPLDKLHAFTYDIDTHIAYFKDIPLSSIKNLKRFNLKKNRYDTIREGTLIFNEILEHIDAESVISSSVGVREGVFLEHLLKENSLKFPTKVNPSITSILDRFNPLEAIKSEQKSKLKLASHLYSILQNEIGDKERYKKELLWALQLSNIGKTLTIYNANQHAFYIAIQELNYGFNHKQILLVSLLLRMYEKELSQKPLFQKFKSLLPKKQTFLWLNFIYTLITILHETSNSTDIIFKYKKGILYILSNKPLYLAKESIKALEKPIHFTIIVKDKSNFPKNKSLKI